MQAICNSLLSVLVLSVFAGANAAGFDAELENGVAHTHFHDCADCPEMVVIPPGSFDMGSNDGAANEKPVHRVTFTKSFAMSKTEVTQGQWNFIMGNNPSRFFNCGESCPVEQVSWEDAQAFIRKLNAKTGKLYRLPSEAEWEYAARADSTTTYPWGNQASHEYANYGDDECCQGLAQGRDQWVNTAPVGRFPANAFGLHDMIGNVWEWVDDSYHDSYTDAPMDGSAWSGDGANHVVRGGSWNFDPQFLGVAIRSRFEPAFRINSIGFRLARRLP
jgi:formylglycine-generating enzyme required for sulfatase activity